MAQRNNLPAYRELDKLVLEGRAQLVATPTADTGTTPTIFAAPPGMVGIITRIFGTALPSSDTSPGLNDAGAFHQITLYDENGDATDEILRFIAGQRVDAAYFSPSATESSWMSAPMNTPVSWDLNDPIIVPPKHTLRCDFANASAALAGGNFVARGYITDEATARMLGFAVGTQDVTYKVTTSGALGGTPKNLSGFRSGTVTAPVGGGIPNIVTLVPSYTDHCIQINDICIRMQPLSAGSTTRKAWLVQSESAAAAVIEVGTATGIDPVLVMCNNNHGDMAELKLSPGIFLDVSHGFYLLTDTTNDSRISVSLTYRYVHKNNVPEGQWWSYASITPPGANTNTTGTSSLYTDGSTTFTAFYAGRSAKGRSATTATTPGTGFQHVVEGYAVSAQKDPTIPGDRAYFAITSGAEDGNIGISGGGLTTTNNLITPIMCLGAHNQMMAIGEDGLNVPCLKDTGAIKLEITGRGAASSTPAQNDLDIDEFHVLVWGRTIPSAYGLGHFQGAAS